ncbi:MAG: hypothetical protein V3U92_17320 [Cellulophaga sp.]
MKDKTATDNKVLTLPIRIFLVVFLLGILAKIAQFPFASQTLFIAFMAIGVLYSIRFLKKSEKKFLDYVKVVLVTFWATNGLLEILHFAYSIYFQTISIVSFVIWIVMEGATYFLNEKNEEKKNKIATILWNCTMIFGIVAIIFGAMLKLLQWEFAMPLLILGCIANIAYILKDVLVKNINSEPNSENTTSN